METLSEIMEKEAELDILSRGVIIRDIFFLRPHGYFESYDKLAASAFKRFHWVPFVGIFREFDDVDEVEFYKRSTVGIDMLKTCQAREIHCMSGDKYQVRGFAVDADEMADAILDAVEPKKNPNPPSVLSLVRCIKKVTGFTPTRILYTESDRLLICYRDTSKAISISIDCDEDGDFGVIYQLKDKSFGSCLLLDDSHTLTSEVKELFGVLDK